MLQRRLHHDLEYHSKQEQDDRAVRFPSVEERVRIYMSDWYAPPCPFDNNEEDDEDGKVQFNFQLFVPQDDPSRDQKSPHTKLYIREASSSLRTQQQAARLFELQGTVETKSSTLFYLHPNALQDCKQEACADVLRTVPPFGGNTRGAPAASSRIPTLLDLGDKEWSTAYQPKEAIQGMNPTVPRLKKFRLAYTKEEMDHMTAYTCVKGRRDALLSSSSSSSSDASAFVDDSTTTTTMGQHVVQPIVWKLKVARHYGMLKNVTAWDIPFADKKDKALFRGRLSGIHKVWSVLHALLSVLIVDSCQEGFVCNGKGHGSASQAFRV
jgi:hypothetical protein